MRPKVCPATASTSGGIDTETGATGPAPRRRAARLLAALVLLGCQGLLLVAAPPAAAHTRVVRTAPASREVVTTAPTQVSVIFDEEVDAARGVMTVLAPDGGPAHRGDVRQGDDPATIVVPLREDPSRGSYVVRYRMVSADGHPISGGFVFSIGAPSTPAVQVPGNGPASVDSRVRAALWIVRGAGYLGIALLAGTVLMVTAFRPAGLSLRRPRVWARAGWILVLSGAVAGVVVQGPYGAGVPLSGVDGEMIAATAGSTVGAAQLARVVLLLAIAPWLVRGFSGRPSARFPLRVCGVAICLTWPLAGHAGAEPLWPVAVAVGALHVAAMAVWLGGLLVLARGLHPAADPRELAAVLPVWSRWAAGAMIALVGTGAVRAMATVGSLTALAGSDYGRLLVAKVAAVVVTMAVASRARRSVLTPRPVPALPVPTLPVPTLPVPTLPVPTLPVPTLVPGPRVPAVGSGGTTTAQLLAEHSPAVPGPGPDAGRLRRLVRVELVVAAVVLVLATALVQTPPGRAAVAVAPGEGTAAVQHATTTYGGVIRSPTMTVLVDVAPAVVGVNTVAITALDPAGATVKVVAWTASASLPEKGVRDLPLGLRPFAEGLAVGSPSLPAAGNWIFSITIRTSDVDQVTLTHTVPIGAG